jgi:CheY-like chemotaxis protein
MPDGGSLSMKAANVDITQERTHMGLTIAPGSFVVVTVSDSGTGIDEEELEQIFEPFYTTKEVGKGTGLGLASVLSIARNHGGMVEASSKPGLGTSMSFYVPADPDAITDAEGGSLEALARGNGETVLVIDDEATLRDVTAEALELHGYRSLTASDGAEGVAVYAQHKDEIQLVVTDMTMPIMDGRAVIRALQRIDPGVRIIAVSGLEDQRAVAAEAGCGTQAFLVKPFEGETLLRTVHEVISAPRGEESP